MAQTSVTSSEGGNVTLRCFVDAVPVVTSAFWLYNGAVIDERFYAISNDSTSLEMMLENVTRTDAGSYTCHVENRLGGATSAPVELNIQCKFAVLYVLALVSYSKRRVLIDLENI